MAQDLSIVIDGGRMTAINQNIKMGFLGAKLRVIPKLAKKLEDIVRLNVDASGISDPSGKIKRWQVVRIGTKYGYAAVSAVRKPDGPNGAGAITNYLNNGHKVRFPSGKSDRYKPRVHCAKAKSFRFYADAAEDVNRLSDEYALQLEKDIAAAIENQRMADDAWALDDAGIRGA